MLHLPFSIILYFQALERTFPVSATVLQMQITPFHGVDMPQFWVVRKISFQERNK